MKLITAIFLMAIPALCMDHQSLTSTATTTSLLSAEAPAIIYSTISSLEGHYTHIPSSLLVIEHNRTRLNGTNHEPHPIFTGTKHEVNGTEKILVNPSLIPSKSGAVMTGGDVSMGLIGAVGLVAWVGM